jgi:hypothetical protein
MFRRTIVWIEALLLSATAVLAVPNTMNYQGQLFQNGTPTQGPASIIFRMYDAPTAGNLLWTETDNVTVTQGLFQTTLGDGTPFPANLFSTQVPWLEMEVNGTVLSPRTQFQSVPYALNAPATGGSEVWSTDGTNVWRLGGKVGIGLMNPQANVDMVGNFKLRLSSIGDNSSLSLNTAPESPSIGFHASDNSERFTIASAFSANNLNDLLSFNGSLAGNMLVLNGNGNVGIGTNAPTERLHVAGNARLEGSVYLGGNQGLNIRLADGSGDIPVLSMSAVGNVTMLTANSMYFSTINGGTTVMSIDHNGLVNIFGDLNVTGSKCRVVKTPSGELKMNAVESSHALFMEDEPLARLANGQCRVTLSPKFLSTVTINGEYPLIVDVTFYGPHGGGWYVQHDDTGFTVIDPSGSNAEFSWDVKARQKGYEDVNLDPVTTTAVK